MFKWIFEYIRYIKLRYSMWKVRRRVTDRILKRAFGKEYKKVKKNCITYKLK